MDKNDLISTHNNRVYDNFLIHWKYVKREKITGAKKGENKWKYFYKDDKSSKNKPGIVDKIKDIVGYDEKEAYKKSKSKLDEAREKAQKAKELMDKASSELDAAYNKKRSAEQASKQKRGAESEQQRKKNLDTATKQVSDASKKYLDAVDKAVDTSKKANTAYEEYSAAKYAYEDTAVYKVSEFYDNAKEVINTGKEAASDLLDKVDDKLDSVIEDLKNKADESKEKIDEIVDKVVYLLDPAARKAKKEAEEQAKREAEAAEAEAYAKQARENALARGEEALSDLPMKTREYSKDEDQAAINPNYEEGEEWQTNCAYCTAAYDLRRRGYDVEAMPCDDATYDATLESIPTWYEDTSKADWSGDASVDWFGRIDYDNISKIHADTKKTFDEMPDGSYGQFCVYWTIGGGHSMVWEKENGTTYIRDCQTNETVTHDEWVSYYGDWSYGAYVLRTDNRVPSENILKTVKEREDKPKEDKSKGSYTIDHDTANTYVYVYDVGQKQGTKKQLTQFK